MIPDFLQPNLTPGSKITEAEGGAWRLDIPAGPAGRYRLAQLDDYSRLRRPAFPWRAPCALQFEARASQIEIPGTWGVGLWNDPFSLSLGLGGGTRRFPALPDTAWFFFASPPNALSIYDDQPGAGSLAAVFRSSPLPAPLLALGSIFAPLLAFPRLARWLRRQARRYVQQDSKTMLLDPTAWHTYCLEWLPDRVRFRADGWEWSSAVAPHGPLGLVIWVDNQYAAFPPDGRLRYGTLPNPEPAWIELRNFEINKN